MCDHYVRSLFKTISQLREDGHEVYYSTASGSDIVDLRNTLGGGKRDAGESQAGHADYDYTLWVDSDQKWEPWMVYQLMGHDRDICAGVVRTTDMDYNFFSNDTRLKSGERDRKLPKKPIKVSAVGFGFILIKPSVWPRIPYPWFRTLPSLDGKLGDSSEDVSFCRKAREAGIDIWIDPEVKVGHCKSIVI